MMAVPEEKRDVKDGVVQAGRWQARYDEIPRLVESASMKLIAAAISEAFSEAASAEQWKYGRIEGPRRCALLRAVAAVLWRAGLCWQLVFDAVQAIGSSRS
jgi:hypothetical protein